MIAGQSHADPSSLRHALKQRTRILHDELDSALGHAVLDPHGYAAFLSVQHAARAAIERWAAQAMPADIAPPATAHLIAADLVELGSRPSVDAEFRFPEGADPIGVAWALGGSSMGNRAMLVQRRKAGFAAAERFLSDPATSAYFRSLLPRLAEPVSDEEAHAAVMAAEAVFHTFLAAVRAHDVKVAA